MTPHPGRRLAAFAVGALLVAGTAVAIAVPTTRKASVAPATAAAAVGTVGRSGPGVQVGAAAAPPTAGAMGGQAGTTGRAVGQSVPSVSPLADVAAPADTVVRNGSVDVEVAKGHFADAFSAAADVARQVGGFVVATQMSTEVRPVPLGAPTPATPDLAPTPVPGPGGGVSITPFPIVRPDIPSGTLVLRVPGSRFDDARRSLEHLGTVRAEQLSGQDAGGQLADLGARLVDLRAAQDGLRALAAKASSTADLLQIQSQLNTVQQQIDGINAQLDRLHNAVALATIDVRVTEPIPVLAASHPRSVLQLRLAQAGRGVESVVGGTIVAAAYAVPLGVLVLLGVAALNAARRRRTARVPAV
ncbi:MAG: hypothetical protein NVSMB12_21790 [Acidimicrobiales bacterium]